MKQRLALVAVVVVAGAALMAYELAGSRVLAPFFGNSIFVWGSLIGVFLGALSVGYAVGGRIGDRIPSFGGLSVVLWIAAVLVVATSVAADSVQSRIVVWDFGVRMNPLLASLVIFGPASVLMGMVSPYAIRLSARDIERVGTTAGTLYALSTAGSIVGTISSAFWLVPALGTDAIMGLIAFALAFAGLVCAIVDARARFVLPAIVVLLAALAAASTLAGARQDDAQGRARAVASWSPTFRSTGYREQVELGKGARVREERDTQYHHVVIVDDGDTRLLRFDNSWQAASYLRDGKPDHSRVRFDYVAALDLAKLYRPDARKALFIGLGAGSAPMRMARLHPQMEIHAIEIDPAVVEFATRWFDLDEETVEVVVGDGRAQLAARDEQYDLIVLDAYFAESIPFHLVTDEFLQVVERRLRPGGLVAANLIGALEGERSRLLRSMVRTYLGRFDEVALHPTQARFDEGVYDPRKTGSDQARDFDNVELFASDEPLLSYQGIVAAARRESASPLADPRLVHYARNRYDAELPVDGVPRLTDDYAPVDALLNLY